MLPGLFIGKKERGRERSCHAVVIAGAFAVLLTLTATYAAAQGVPAQLAQADTQKAFNIPAQPLSSALIAFGEQAGLQFSVDTSIVGNARTGGLSGRYSVQDGLNRLLAGSGIAFRFTATNTVVLEKALNAKGARVLGPVQVEGVQTAGANGSTDVTATEGTGSYTSGALTVGSKVPLSMRQTPQSVSVVTQQRMQDQNLTDLTSVLNQATGVISITGGNTDVSPAFYSRGFQITNLQFDGGASLNYTTVNGYYPLIDLAEYDHIELLRGADGMFAGAGTPGGTVNLVRKRPLDHNQTLLEGDAGSWDNYRAMMDVTGPLALDGKLRGRLAMSYQSQDHFYETASSNRLVLYGIIEADPTSTTLLTIGGSFARQNTVPWYNGLPRFQDGGDLHLPRSTCLCTNWNRWNFTTSEIFLKLDQRIDEDWSVKANLTSLRQSSSGKYGFISGTINPNTLAGASLTGAQVNPTIRQYLADVTVNGAFELFARRQEIVAGANWQSIDADGFKAFPALSFGSPASPPVNLFTFNPSAYPEPASNSPSFYDPVNGSSQYGAYLTTRFQVVDDLHLLAGFRVSGFQLKSIFQSLNPDGTAKGSPSLTRYSETGVITPYAGLVYDLSEIWSLYGSYTDIFQSQALDLQGPPPGTPLQPILGSEYEAGVKGELLDGALNTSLSIYRINRKNAATLHDPNYPFGIGATGGSCCFLAGGNVESEGVDAEVTGRIMSGWQIFAGYTYNYNRTLYDGTPSDQNLIYQSRFPKHLFKLWTTYQLPDAWNQWTLGFGVNAQSSSYQSGSACTVYASPTTCKTSVLYHFTQGGYGVFSARVAYQVDDHWSAALNVNNILDKTYYQTIGNSTGNNWYGDPRNFMFTLRYQN